MGSTRTTHLRLMGALLAGIGLFVYTSPAAPNPDTLAAASASSASPIGAPTARDAARAKAARANVRTKVAAGTDALDGGTKRKATAATTPKAKPAAKKPAGAKAGTRAASRTSASGRRPSSTTTRPPLTTTSTTTPAPHAPRCSDFHWQQDAQAAYVADLNDPAGLDGPPGPMNDDGLACSLLPVDLNRPPSTPAGARPPAPPKPEGLPETPTLAQALAPTDTYFGVSTPQAPYD